ncbi:MAG: tyrosinase family protein [Saprospiraceae bacterium]|nr:tyrosinase family protein [Saprospiraceae bacterium]
MFNNLTTSLWRPLQYGRALFLTLLLLFCISAVVQAQRAPRPSLNDPALWGDANKRATLRDLILEWITEPMNTQHGVEFATIHNTRNFLPWHRIHIRELEDFINEVNPDLLQPSGLLPFYNPINPMPAEFVDQVADFIPANLQFPMNPNPNHPDNFVLCASQNSNAGAFSNRLENNYHNGGHIAMGGTMVVGDPTNAAACAIFWPWHAWVDEKWFQWECQCNNVFNMDTPAELIISQNTTWGTNRSVRGVVEINSGATLTINAGAVIRFAPSEYNGCVTKVVVKPGGRLIVDNATLTGLDEFGTGGDGGTGIHYFSSWEGIEVQGTGTASIGAQGRITVRNGSIIEHTSTAVEAKDGGLVFIDGAKFLNNRYDIVIGDHKFTYLGYVRNCEMINDMVLRDISWTSSPVGGVPVEHHFNHHDSHSSEVHITAGNGNVGLKGLSVNNCKIENPFKDPHGNYLSIGIKTNNARLSVRGSTIKEQTQGIMGANSIPGPGRNIAVSTSTFDKNYVGIYMKAVDHSSINNGCSFLIPNDVPAGFTPSGIISDGSSALTIADNDFSSVDLGGTMTNYGSILMNTSGNFASVEKRNKFTGLSIGSQTQGSNSNLQIRCNDFNSFAFGIAVADGSLANQGECNGTTTAPAGNVWDNLGTCIDDESQIVVMSGAAGFTYRAHNNRIPECVSPDVTVQNCAIAAIETSCDDPDPCNGLPRPCPKEIVIADLESQKIGQDLEGVNALTRRQQYVMQDEINRILDENGETGLSDAVNFVAAVEPNTSVYPVNKAALLLQQSEDGIMAAGTSAAINSLSGLDPNKAWLQLQYNLLDTDRDYNALSAAELNFVETEVGQPTRSGAFARAFYQVAYGKHVGAEILPVGGGDRGEQPTESTTNAFVNALTIAPNPANEWVLATFDAPLSTHRSMLVLCDLNGRNVRELNISEIHGPTQLSIPLDGLAEGIYVLRLHLNGQFSGVQKVVVMH